MQLARYILVSTVLLVTASAATSAGADPFERGSVRGSVVVGSGRAFDDDYTVFGLSAGYFFAPGLEAGVDAEWWSGGERDISKISPQVRYVMPLEGPVRPYAGAFYRHTSVEDLDDLESAGYRLGGYLLTGANTYLSAGWVQEYYLDCDEDVYRSCDDSYVELSFGISLR